MCGYRKVLGLCVVLALFFSGCTAISPSSTGDGDITASSEEEIAYGCPGETATTLTFWYEGAAVGTMNIFREAMDKFEEAHPNVTIDLLSVPFEDMLRTLPLALDAGTGPDIATLLPLESLTFPAAQAGHLLELTQIAEEHGWLDKYDTKALDVNNRGLGGIYGFPYEWTLTGVYYNADIFDELGLTPPTTLAEFEQTMATLSEAGVMPLSVGGRDGWPLMHVWQALAHTNVEYSVIRALEDRDPSATYEDPGLIEAAHKVKEWVDLGYLDPNGLSTSFVDANNLFINGDAAMNLGGTWVQADFRGAPFNVGFFALPAMRTDLEPRIGGFTPASDFTIMKEGRNRACALELLGYLLSDETMQFFWEKGLLVPYRFDPVPDATDALQSDIYAAMQANGAGHFIGVSAPETARVTWAGLQEIFSGARTPEDVFAQIQETYKGEVGQ